MCCHHHFVLLAMRRGNAASPNIGNLWIDLSMLWLGLGLSNQTFRPKPRSKAILAGELHPNKGYGKPCSSAWLVGWLVGWIEPKETFIQNAFLLAAIALLVGRGLGGSSPSQSFVAHLSLPLL
jgi:hypothetical protein